MAGSPLHCNITQSGFPNLPTIHAIASVLANPVDIQGAGGVCEASSKLGWTEFIYLMYTYLFSSYLFNYQLIKNV